MEVWYLLVLVPLIQLVRALVDAWKLLLEAADNDERQEIIANAGAKALINTILAVAIAVAPWPYNLLGLVPIAIPPLMSGIASLFGVTLFWKFHGKF